MDNLESQTYEVFEKDPVKYSQYQKVCVYIICVYITNVITNMIINIVHVLLI